MNTPVLSLLQPFAECKEDVVLIGAWLLLLIIAVALFRYLLDCASRVFEASCEWLEAKLAKRKVRRRMLAHLQRMAQYSKPFAIIPRVSPVTVKTITQQPPAPKQSAATILPYQARRPVSAIDALRRSCSER